MSGPVRRPRRGDKRDATITPAAPSRKLRRCSQTGKLRYKTRDKAIGDAQRWAPSEIAYVRAYRCQYCGKWHLTTKEPLPSPQVSS